MAKTFKGLYRKSFKCFSDIFVLIEPIVDEEQKEMEIGNPTDVRHESHIGWDSTSGSSPSWRSLFLEERIEPVIGDGLNNRFGLSDCGIKQLHEFKTSNNILQPDSSWTFQDLKSAMEVFGEVENIKELGKESTKQNLKKKLFYKASLFCTPLSPRFSRISKVFG